MAKNWWKILSVILVLYAIIGGFLINAPGQVGMLDETIRNLFYHVPMWFGMIILLVVSWIFSIKYLRSSDIKHDIIASEMVHVATLLGVLGIITGSVWAKNTWGAWWTKDPKLNGAAIGLLIYFAYLTLRNSMDEEQKRGRISAVYNVLAFPIFIVMIIIIPKITSFSLHPGSGDTVGFKTYDLNNELRKVFYPSVVGWALLGVWIASLRIRLKKIQNELESQ